MTALERFRSALEQAGSTTKGPGAWTCPAHDDQRASLSVKEGRDGRVLINCHAGCDRQDIVSAVGLTMADLFPPREHQERAQIVATYDYTDENGMLLFQAVRFQPKDFRQRRRPQHGDPPDKIRDGWVWSLGDTRRVLYHLPKVVEAIRQGQPIWLAEGEKDVHALERAGLAATCNPMGAGKWRDDYTTTLRDAKAIVIVADLDETGRTHARTVARKLEQAGIGCRIVCAAEGKDAADHLGAGLSPDDFIDLDDDPGTDGPTVADLATTIASYHHIEDSGYIWFALAVAVAGHAFDGEPLWGMLVGPSSSGKTETARALGAVAGHIDDLTASALMSWSKGKNPRQVGVLYRIGDRGVVTIGDFSTVLAASNKGVKDQLFAMLRRIYDGHLTRDLGTHPEQLRWDGRLTILACCTPIIDEYTSHADSLGPRWLYYRIAPRSLEGMRAMTTAARVPAADGRIKAADLAEQIVNTAAQRAKTIQLNEKVTSIISDLAIVACYGRASVPRSSFGRREITGEASREEPARLYKQLTQLVRALLALGATIKDALQLARRCALDSIPQTRRKALELLVTGLEMNVAEIAREIGCDRKVARFALEELAAAGVLSWPESYDNEEDDKQSQWAPRTWKLDGPAAPLIERILTGQPWEQNDVIDERRREITREDVRITHFTSHGSPAEQGDFGLHDPPGRPDPKKYTR